MAAFRKQAKQESINALLKQIQTLGKTHKLTKARYAQTELNLLHTRLREELGRKIRKHFALSQKLFYEHSNNSGRFLARAL